MSALSGIWNFDGRPVSERELALLADHNRLAGPDGGTVARPVSGLALQTQLLRFDRLSATERQPYVFGPGSVLTWDGRLDNREDLLITLHRDLGPEQSDAALVAAAFTRWGLECLPRLIGDWSLVLWDAANHSLMLARDYAGNRPLHYRESREGIAWSTCLDALAAWIDPPFEPDDAFIAGKLTFGVPTEITPFRTVRSLSAGNVLVATPGKNVTIRRFWSFSPRTIRYQRPQEYTEHLRHVLVDAVRVRLRAKETVWSHLSGGWDSSSIVCLAHRLVQRGAVEAPRVQPLSMVSSASPESDESSYISAVERWCGLSSVRREYPGVPSFGDLRGYRHPFPFVPDFTLESAVQAAGDHILLSGQMGDLVMIKGVSQRVSLVEALYEGDVWRFLGLCFKRASYKQRSMFLILGDLARMAYAQTKVGDAETEPLRQFERARRRGAATVDTAHHFGVTSFLLDRVPANVDTPLPSLRDFPVPKRALVRKVQRLIDARMLTSPDAFAAVWRTYPYSHRPLVEFVVGAPHLAFWDPVIYRAGMRRALEDVLAPEVLARTRKGNAAPAVTRAYAVSTTESLNRNTDLDVARNWLLVQRGYLDEQILTRALADANDDQRVSLHKRWLPLEAWLRTLTTSSVGRSINHPRTEQPSSVRDASRAVIAS